MASCVVTGTLYRTDDTPFGPQRRALTVVEVVKSGSLYMAVPLSRDTNASGVVTFTVPQSSVATVYADARGLNTNGTAGVELTIPASGTANLEDLVSIAAVPSTGLTIKDEGTAFASLVGTINFVGTGVSAVETSAGLATVTITAGSGVTLREVDGSPSLAASTVEFLQTSGFVVTDQTGGVGRVDLLAIPVNKLAALTASRVPVTDGSGFLSASSVTDATLAFLDATSSIQTQLNTLSSGKQNTLTNSAGLLAALSDETGTGLAVFNDTPTLVAPILGTPTSGTLTNCTLPVGGISGLGTGVATWLATPSSANLLAAVTGETGTGALVFADTPTLIAPLLGTPTSGVLSNCTGLPPTTGIVGWPANASGVLTNNGSGTLSWAAAGGGGTPGGSDTQVQFNDSSAFGGDAGLTFNKTTNVLTITSGGLVLATAGTITQTSASATAFESGPNGATNPVFRLVNNVASAATGLSITGNASGSGVTLTALGGTNEDIIITPKGTGNIQLLGTSPRVQFGGTTSSFPSLKRSVTDTTYLAAVLADNSNLTGLQASQVLLQSGGHVYFGGTSSSFGSLDNSSAVIRAVLADGSALTSFRAASLFVGGTNAAFGLNAASIVELNNGTTGQWGALLVGVRDAGLNTAPVGFTVGHQTSGTKASITAGMGVSLLLNADSTTTADRNCAQITALFTTPTDASIVSDLVFYTRTGGAALAEVLRVKGNALIVQPQTITAGGTTGAQTIDKPAGTVNMAAGQTALVVTNALVTASSQVFAVIRTNDTTSQIKNVVPTTGSFTINLVSAATAETSIGFWVINA